MALCFQLHGLGKLSPERFASQYEFGTRPETPECPLAETRVGLCIYLCFPVRKPNIWGDTRNTGPSTRSQSGDSVPLLLQIACSLECRGSCRADDGTSQRVSLRVKTHIYYRSPSQLS